jgi:sec-independent protein translocase protein TatA
MFGTLGGPELFLILVVALIVFGPRKLPEIGKSLGKMMAEFRKASNEFKRTIETEVEADKIRESMRIEMPRFDEPSPSKPAEPSVTPSPPSEGPGAPGPGEAGAGAPGHGEPVAETVSRQPGGPPPETK